MLNPRKTRSLMLCSIAMAIVFGFASWARDGVWAALGLGDFRMGLPAVVQSARAMEPASKPTEEENEDLKDDAKSPKQTKALTSEQINRIRYMELNGMRSRDLGPDHATVKISRDTIDEFLLSMEGHEDFRGKRVRREFLKMTPPQKLHVIARYKGAAYADRVQILSDPDIFVEFRKTVLPQVLRGCATSGCHLSTYRDAPSFGFTTSKRTEQATYTNFILLNDLEVGNHRMIDRAKPDESLLLTYLLPPKEVAPELRHPGDAEYRPIFQSRKNARYRMVKKWIESLKHPAEDYGVHLIAPKLPAHVDGDDDSLNDNDSGGGKPTDEPKKVEAPNP